MWKNVSMTMHMWGVGDFNDCLLATHKEHVFWNLNEALREDLRVIPVRNIFLISKLIFKFFKVRWKKSKKNLNQKITLKNPIKLESQKF